jgi:hypothetical protein
MLLFHSWALPSHPPLTFAKHQREHESLPLIARVEQGARD